MTLVAPQHFPFSPSLAPTSPLLFSLLPLARISAPTSADAKIFGLTLCPKCSYDLRAHAPGSLCPECGTPVADKS